MKGLSVAALIAAAFGAGDARAEVVQRRQRLESVGALPYRRRGGGGGNGWTLRLYRKFALNAKARYGLDTLVDGKHDPNIIRVMRNARKAERQAS